MITGSSQIQRWKDNIFRVAAAGNLSTSIIKMGDTQIIHTLIVRDRYVDI
jgi:hypothetical protein